MGMVEVAGAVLTSLELLRRASTLAPEFLQSLQQSVLSRAFTNSERWALAGDDVECLRRRFCEGQADGSRWLVVVGNPVINHRPHGGWFDIPVAKRICETYDLKLDPARVPPEVRRATELFQERVAAGKEDVHYDLCNREGRLYAIVFDEFVRDELDRVLEEHSLVLIGSERANRISGILPEIKRFPIRMEFSGRESRRLRSFVKSVKSRTKYYSGTDVGTIGVCKTEKKGRARYIVVIYGLYERGTSLAVRAFLERFDDVLQGNARSTKWKVRVVHDLAKAYNPWAAEGEWHPKLSFLE